MINSIMKFLSLPLQGGTSSGTNTKRKKKRPSFTQLFIRKWWCTNGTYEYQQKFIRVAFIVARNLWSQWIIDFSDFSVAPTYLFNSFFILNIFLQPLIFGVTCQSNSKFILTWPPISPRVLISQLGSHVLERNKKNMETRWNNVTKWWNHNIRHTSKLGMCSKSI